MAPERPLQRSHTTRRETTMSTSAFTLAVVRGEAPDAAGVEFGLSALADTDLPADVWEWFTEHGVSEHDDNVWVLVTPEPEFRAGDVTGLVAWRDVDSAEPTAPGASARK